MASSGRNGISCCAGSNLLTVGAALRGLLLTIRRASICQLRENAPRGRLEVHRAGAGNSTREALLARAGREEGGAQGTGGQAIGAQPCPKSTNVPAGTGGTRENEEAQSDMGRLKSSLDLRPE
jgi:hypothetical protein